MREYLVQLVDCVGKINGIDLVVAIDGLSASGNPQSLELALSLGVGCVVADYSEGVGISKNRVITLLGGYDYYFFIDDDVAVRSSRLFSEPGKFHLETGIHHFSLHHPQLLAPG